MSSANVADIIASGQAPSTNAADKCAIALFNRVQANVTAAPSFDEIDEVDVEGDNGEIIMTNFVMEYCQNPHKYPKNPDADLEKQEPYDVGTAVQYVGKLGKRLIRDFPNQLRNNTASEIHEGRDWQGNMQGSGRG